MTGRQRGFRDRPQWYYSGPYPADVFRPSREQEVDQLKAQAGYFEDALKDIRKRIENLQASTEGDNI